EAILRLAARRLRPQEGLLAGAEVATDHRPTLALRIDDVRVVGIDAADKPVAAADHDPVAVENAVGQRPARTAPGAVVLESAIVGAVQRHPQDVQELVVAGIDAHLAEVHRPRVERVDPRPRVAAVARFVDTASLKTIRALAVLDVLALAGQVGAPGPAGGAA